MAKIIVNMQASVVEYTLARQIIYVLGFGATRDADTLKVFKEIRDKLDRGYYDGEDIAAMTIR